MTTHKAVHIVGRFTTRIALSAMLLLLGVLARAQDGGAGLVKETQAWLDQAVAAARPAGAAPLRLVVSVGNLDSRLNLAPCAQVEPYIPPGTRLWGKVRLGIRCTDGKARWNVFLPIQVQAFGPAWVVRGDVPAGKVLEADDAVQAEVDWAQENATVLADMEMWLGQTAIRALGTGQTLRAGMVRPPQVFQAGAMVRVVAQGAGFSVMSDGQAISAGILGSQARVRMEGGRILTGVVTDHRTIRVDL